MGVENLSRKTLTEDSFSYGEHTIEVHIRIRHGAGGKDAAKHIGGHYGYRILRVLNDFSAGYKRDVYVSATQKDEFGKVSNDSSVTLLNTGKGKGLLKYLPRCREPSVEDQIEATVRPILDELDEFYQVASQDVDLDIRLGMERVEHETSWVEVDNEIDRISQSIENETESVVSE